MTHDPDPVTAIQAGQLALALAGTALLLWEGWLIRRGRPATARVARARLFGALVVLGVAAYANFGALHRTGSMHYWDTYHYYIGAKYFPELGYDRLYACTAVVDAETGLRRDAAGRLMTDLGSNLQVPTREILAHPEHCKRWFTAARWDGFVRDVAWFRDRMDRRTWHRAQRDHGYNATPVWNALGHALANLAPASELQITCLVLLDPLLVIAMFILLGRCFGWRVAAVAAVLLGAYFPARFYWTGGAFLRFDWVFCMVAGLCALRTRRPLLAGAALGYAALLRVFPAALLVGPAIAVVVHLRRTGTWHRAYLRLFAGVALAAAIAIPPALIVAGDGAVGFLANTAKHADTPLTNHMGLGVVLAYDPDSTVRELRAADARDLWPRYKQARRQGLRETRLALLAIGLVCLGVLALAAREAPWRLAAMSSILIAVALQLTSYYYVFVIAWAVLAEDRPGPGAALLGMCAASMALALGVVPHLGMDETYTVMTLVTLAGLGGAMALAVDRTPGARPPDQSRTFSIV